MQKVSVNAPTEVLRFSDHKWYHIIMKSLASPALDTVGVCCAEATLPTWISETDTALFTMALDARENHSLIMTFEEACS